VAGLALMGIQVNRGRALTSEQINQPLQGASRATVKLNPAVGTIRLDAAPSASNLIEGRVLPVRGERVTGNFSLSGDTATYSLQGSGGTFFNYSDVKNATWGWDLSLAPGIPLDLTTSLGVGESEIDLSGLTISTLDVSLGVGQTTVILPEAGSFQGKIEGAIGQIVILIPAEMAVRRDTMYDNVERTNSMEQELRVLIVEDVASDAEITEAELRHELDAGVVFWGWEQAGKLVGVMGLQDVADVALIRHAYVATAARRKGIGGGMLKFLLARTSRPVLIGTWAAATWAIRFYEQHGFRVVSLAEKERLLRKYWRIPDRQIETSVVLADPKWPAKEDAAVC